MILDKGKAVLAMDCLEKRLFLLDNRAKVVLLERISHCLRCNRRGEDVVDVMCSLNSIIKLSSGDLMHNRLFVTKGKFGRMATFAILLV